MSAIVTFRPDPNSVKSKEFLERNELLARTLAEFYANPEHRQRILPLVGNNNTKGKKDTRISLRLVEWVIINYARDSTDMEIHKFYQMYKCALKTFSKKRLDMFKRSDTVIMCFPDSQNQATPGAKKLVTTLGQLNFLKWVITCGAFDYIVQNIDMLNHAMNHAKKDLPKKKKIHVQKRVTDRDVIMTVRFD